MMLPKKNLAIYNQRGAALLVLMSIMILTIAIIVVGNRSRNTSQLERDHDINQILEAARVEMIGFAMQNNSVPGMLPFPDRLAGGYDGLGDCSGGALPIDPAILIGRFPYRGQGVGGGGCTNIFTSFNSDRSQEPLHYVVSPNLIQYNFTVGINLITNTLNADVLIETDGWLTVFDAKGNPTPRVAFIVFYPGSALTTSTGYTQNRNALAAPSEYLDSFTLPPPLSLTIDNANPTNALQFVQGDLSATFNDRLVFVTVDQLLNPVAMRRAELRFLTRLATELSNDYDSGTFPADQATLAMVAKYNDEPFVHWLSVTSRNSYDEQIGGTNGYDSFIYTLATDCNGTAHAAVVFGSTQFAPLLQQCVGAD